VKWRIKWKINGKTARASQELVFGEMALVGSDE